MGIVGLFNVLRHLRMFRRDLRRAHRRDRAREARCRAARRLSRIQSARGAALQGARAARRLLHLAAALGVAAGAREADREVRRPDDRHLSVRGDFYREHGIAGDVRRPSADRRDRAGIEARRRNGRRRCASRCCRDRAKARCESLLPAMLDAVEILARERGRRRVHRPGADDPARDARTIVRATGATFASSRTTRRSRGRRGRRALVLRHRHARMRGPRHAGRRHVSLCRANYWLGRMLVQIPHFSLVNIVAGKKVVPELIQERRERRAHRGRSAAARSRRQLRDGRATSSPAVADASSATPGASRDARPRKS